MKQVTKQADISLLSQHDWEIVVIGAGPAGAVCAGLLGGDGHEVLIIDKDQFPREKSCGDLLLADSISILNRINLFKKVQPSAHQVSAIEVFSPSQNRFNIPGQYLTIRRKLFDQILVEHACHTQNTIFAKGYVNNIIPGRNSQLTEIHFNGDPDITLRAKVVVVATGGVANLPYRVGLVVDRLPSAIALRGYIKSSFQVDDIIISYDKSILPGYGWIVPMGTDEDGLFLYNVGCGRSYTSSKDSLSQTYNTFLNSFSLARQLIEHGQPPSEVKGAPLRCGLPRDNRKQKGNMLAIGEAIGATFPFTGEGIGMAMQSGMIAAEIIHEALLSSDMSYLNRYPDELNRTIKPVYASYQKAEKWLSYSWLNDFVAVRIASSKYLQEQLQKFMSAESTPDIVFGVKGLLISYFK